MGGLMNGWGTAREWCSIALCTHGDWWWGLQATVLEWSSWTPLSSSWTPLSTTWAVWLRPPSGDLNVPHICAVQLTKAHGGIPSVGTLGMVITTPNCSSCSSSSSSSTTPSWRMYSCIWGNDNNFGEELLKTRSPKKDWSILVFRNLGSKQTCQFSA